MDGQVEQLPHHLLRPRMQCDLFIFCRIGTHIVFLLVVFLWGPKLPFFLASAPLRAYQQPRGSGKAHRYQPGRTDPLQGSGDIKGRNWGRK